MEKQNELYMADGDTINPNLNLDKVIKKANATEKEESCAHDHRITRISWKDNSSISECQKCKIVWNEETDEVIKRP